MKQTKLQILEEYADRLENYLKMISLNGALDYIKCVNAIRKIKGDMLKNGS